MAQFNTMSCVMFLLGLLTLALITQAFPETIRVQIQNGEEIIALNWRRTDRSVANLNFPIWRAWRLREPELVTGVLEDIGPFTMYHDLAKSSAIVLFQHSERIYGVLDTRFWISALPFSEIGPDKMHIVHDNGYVRRRIAEDLFHDEIHDFPAADIDMPYINSFVDNWLASSPHGSPRSMPSLDPYNIFSSRHVQGGSSGRSHTHSSSSSLSNSGSHNVHMDTDPPHDSSDAIPNTIDLTSHQGSDTLYAEVLVLISHNVLKYFTKRDPDLKLLLAYYLIYFNAIDMLFAKLPDDIRIHINIAGMVLESQIMVFPYAFWKSDERPLRIIDGAKTLSQFPVYLKKYKNVFPRDSFDFFYLATRFFIQDKEDNDSSISSQDGSSSSTGDSSDASSSMKNFVSCDGISRLVTTYENRRLSRAVNDVPGLIVERKSVHGDYITAAHELAHLMFVDHDAESQGLTCEGGQCFAILQAVASYCRNCIRWSDKSIREFRTYARDNLDHCFLLNEPRSLHPYGTLMKTLEPTQQCRCYKYDAYWTKTGHLDRVHGHRCSKKLTCGLNNQRVVAAIPKPIDGTPCGDNKNIISDKTNIGMVLGLLEEPMSGVADTPFSTVSSLNIALESNSLHASTKISMTRDRCDNPPRYTGIMYNDEILHDRLYHENYILEVIRCQ